MVFFFYKSCPRVQIIAMVSAINIYSYFVMKSKGKTIFCDKHQYIITLGGFQKITNDYRRGGGSVNDYLLKNEIYDIFFYAIFSKLV